MPTRVKLEDLLAAQGWLSTAESAALMDCSAYVSRATGQVIWVGEGVDDEPPTTSTMGRPLVIHLVREHLPGQGGKVDQMFSRRGAYSHFKSLVDRAGQLQAGYRYDQAAVTSALRDGCDAEGFIAEL